MSLIKKNDLKYNYTWSQKGANTPRSDRLTETSSRSNMFSASEGEGVLEFINDYAQKHGIEDKEEALRIERLLHEEMEDREMTREEVRLWLDEQMRGK